jgi:hypothetical protein
MGGVFGDRIATTSPLPIPLRLSADASIAQRRECSSQLFFLSMDDRHAIRKVGTARLEVLLLTRGDSLMKDACRDESKVQECESTRSTKHILKMLYMIHRERQ